MNEWIIHGINIVLLIVFYLLYYRKKLDKTMLGAAAELIPEAEEIFRDQLKSGEAKKEWVVDRIMELMSVVQRTLLSRESVGEAVQFVFDRICGLMKVK